MTGALQLLEGHSIGVSFDAEIAACREAEVEGAVALALERVVYRPVGCAVPGRFFLACVFVAVRFVFVTLLFGLELLAFTLACKLPFDLLE